MHHFHGCMFPTDEDTWGHTPEQIGDTTLRIIFNNIRGLKISTDNFDTQLCFSTASNTGAEILCLAETNTNWDHPRSHQVLKQLTSKTWLHSAYIPSNMREELKGTSQPGGTLTMVTGHLTSRVIKKGTDPYGLGQWSYITLSGKDGDTITCITAYRVCTQSVLSAGPRTSTAQQFRTLSAHRGSDPSKTIHCRSAGMDRKPHSRPTQNNTHHRRQQRYLRYPRILHSIAIPAIETDTHTRT
jgi:hypothetical protein